MKLDSTLLRDNLTKEQLFSLKAGTPDRDIYNKIKENWDHLSKPIDGLGDFEEVLCRIGAISGKSGISLDKKEAVIFCADNGIVDEGVSQTGKEVTLKVAKMLGRGESSANTLARGCGCSVTAVNIGIDSAESIPGVRDLKVRRGTGDFLKEKAMTEGDVLKAIGIGIDLAKELKESGTNIILSGEMGIGNTTTATTLFCLLTRDEPYEVVGRGAGLSDEGLTRKLRVVEEAVLTCRDGELIKNALMKGAVQKDAAFDLMCSVGGLDIAGLCGLFIGGSVYEIPVVIDGLITAVAALLAEIFVPGSRNYMLASHSGREKGLLRALSLLGLKPLLCGNMALGEGTGAIMLMPLLEGALFFYKNASTFKEGNIEEYKRFDDDSSSGKA